MRASLLLCAALLLQCPALLTGQTEESDLDHYWEDEEPATRQAPYKPPPAASAAVQQGSNGTAAAAPLKRRPLRAADYPLELLGLAVMLYYAYNIFSGERCAATVKVLSLQRVQSSVHVQAPRRTSASQWALRPPAALTRACWSATSASCAPLCVLSAYCTLFTCSRPNSLVTTGLH